MVGLSVKMEILAEEVIVVGGQVDSVELGLRIGEIVAIGVSIFFASYLAWYLYDRGWKRDRLEKLVRDVVGPLLDELDKSLVGDRKSGEYAGGLYRGAWEHARNDPLWLALIPPKIQVQAREYYGGKEHFRDSRQVARRRALDIASSTFNEYLLKKDVEAQKHKPDIDHYVNSWFSDALIIYFSRGWQAVRNRFHENISQFVQDFCDRHDEACRVSVSADDLLTVIGSRWERDEAMQRFKEVRLAQIDRGDKLNKDLQDWKKKQLNILYRKRASFSMMWKLQK